MLVPRSFKYSSSPPSSPEARPRSLNDSRPKSTRLSSEPAWSSPLAVGTRYSAPQQTDSSSLPSSPIISPTSMNMRPASKPVEIPSPRSSGDFSSIHSGRTRGTHATRRSRQHDQSHRADALPPAVAALLAVTAIPPPRKTPSNRKRTSSASRRISIDELVQEWRNDSSLKPSFASSASLGLLLESVDEANDDRPAYSRSSSCDSIPSLDADDSSVISIGSPATPESLRSQRSSSTTPRKDKAIFSIETEECGLEHPLGLSGYDADQDLELLSTPTPKIKRDTRRKSSSFTSNLTSSLQALKSRALSSISSLNQVINQADGAFSDESLWQHPYVFPRLSSEVRPRAFTATPSSSQRRYFNRNLLPFEEQQQHWSAALSTLDEEDTSAPMIQMQTYRRPSPSVGRKARRNSGAPDSRTEAGRALAAPLGAPQLSRQREVRENSNFLRVIVLEMNMRRKGKLEEGSAGKAKIWLPPRRVAVVVEDVFEDENEEDESVGKKIPKRWVGVSADY